MSAVSLSSISYQLVVFVVFSISLSLLLTKMSRGCISTPPHSSFKYTLDYRSAILAFFSVMLQCILHLIFCTRSISLVTYRTSGQLKLLGLERQSKIVHSLSDRTWQTAPSSWLMHWMAALYQLLFVFLVKTQKSVEFGCSLDAGLGGNAEQ